MPLYYRYIPVKANVTMMEVLTIDHYQWTVTQ